MEIIVLRKSVHYACVRDSINMRYIYFRRLNPLCLTELCMFKCSVIDRVMLHRATDKESPSEDYEVH